jgi:hypothetical protein
MVATEYSLGNCPKYAGSGCLSRLGTAHILVSALSDKCFIMALLMKRLVLSLILFGSALVAATPQTTIASTPDYALMSATPYNSEIALARERLQRFLAKTDPKKRAILAQNPIVAVEAYVLTAGEVGPILRRLNRGRYGGYIQDYYYRGETEVKFLLLFDSRNGQLVSNDGVLVVDTPSRGHVGMFGGISALYIGREW